MAFDNFCIYPKTGVFTIKEAVSSFDPTPVGQAIPVDIKEVDDDDPIVKLREHLRPAYEQAKRIYHLDMSYHDNDSAMQQLESIDYAVTTIAESLQKTYIKLMNKICLYNGFYHINYIMQSFNNYAGIILPKINYLLKNGYVGYNYDVDVISCLDGYKIRMALNSIIDNQATMMSTYLDIDTIDVLSPYDRGNYQVFTSFTDLYQCFFDDIERLCKLERPNHCDISLERLIANSQNGNDICCSNDTFDFLHNNILKFISNNLAIVKHSIYELQVSIMDHDSFDANSYTNAIRKMNAICLNLFNFTMLMIINDGYNLRELVERKKNVDIFINDIVQKLKSTD